MIWLTRVRVSLREAAVRRLGDPYAWHQALWRGFPGKDGQSRNFLTRIDRKDHGFEAMILSTDKPLPLEWGEWQSKEISKTFLGHNRYRFALRANPTVKRTSLDAAGNPKKNSRRVAIRDSEELRQWLSRKAKQSGFSLEAMSFTPPIDQNFYKKGTKGVHAAVDFQGVLRVDDRKAFRQTFAEGIGPARAFGFGMLMLQPIFD